MNEPYPINIILKNKSVAVIGGGEVAERKVLGLLDTGAKITVIAPDATKKIKSLSAQKKLVFKPRDFCDSDLNGKFLVFVSTDSEKVNKRASRLARKKGVLVNCADSPKECDFFVPSFFRRGSLSWAISTGGKIPALAKKIRREIELLYGEVYADYVDLLAKARAKIYRESSLNKERQKERIEKLIDNNLLSLLKEGKKKEALQNIREFLQKNCYDKDSKEDHETFRKF